MKTEYHQKLEEYLILEGFKLYRLSDTIQLVKANKIVHSWKIPYYSHYDAIMVINAEIAQSSLLYA